MRPLLWILLLPLACAPKTLEQKMRYAERLTDDAGPELEAAERHLRALEPEEADQKLREVRERLSDPLVEHSPESEMMQSRLEELTAKLPEVREAKRQRDLDEAVRGRRSTIGPRLQSLRDALEALSGKDLDRPKLSAAEAAADALAREISGDLRELELRDEDFASYLKRARAELESARQDVSHATARLAFLEGPVAQRSSATETLKAARSEKDPSRKLELLEAAAGAFKSCEDGAATHGATLGKTAVALPKGTLTADALAASCRSSRQGMKKQLDSALKAKARQEKARIEKSKKKPAKR